MTLIYDRTAPGSYYYPDYNRVETAAATLAGALREMPSKLRAYAQERGVAWDVLFNVPYDPAAYAITTKTDWAREDIPFPEDMERYLGNVRLLRAALDYATDDLPEGMDNLTWTGANAIERALDGLDAAIIAYREQIEEYMRNIAAAWFYSGELYGGEA